LSGVLYLCSTYKPNQMNIKINETWGTPKLKSIIHDFGSHLTGDEKAVNEVKDNLNKFIKNKIYLLSDNVKEQIEKIVVTNDNGMIDMNYIKHLPHVSENIVWDKQIHYCYSFDGNDLVFVVFKIMIDPLDKTGIDYRHTYFNFDINNFENSLRENKDKIGGEFMEMVELLIRMIVFLHMTPVTYKFIESKGKVGDFIKGTQVKNEMRLPITLVDINWNHITIRTEGFDVRGHWRLQRHGKGWSEVYLKFIQPYGKNGYVRKYKKELV